MFSAQKLFKIMVVVSVLVIGLLAYKVNPTGTLLFPLLPPLLAISLAVATRQVLPALFTGVWVAGLMVTGYNPVAATSKTLEWIVASASDSWNATILVFDFIIGAFVGVLYASGAIHSLASSIATKIRSSRAASLLASVLGVVIFFDDYTNTIVVGNATRPITDKTRVSRELLSYIVDSTAAPVAGIALVSTWIGYEVGLIKGGLGSIGVDMAAYAAWLQSVPFRFYSILAIILVFLAVMTRRHIGPMLKAEHRAVGEGKVLRDGAKPLMPTEEILKVVSDTRKTPGWVFIASIIALVSVTLLGIWYTGAEAVIQASKLNIPWWQVSFGKALMESDSATALLWGSFAAYLLALAASLLYRSLSFEKAMEYTLKGMYLMVYANAILLLAWSIKSGVDAVGTAGYVVSLARSIAFPAALVPLVIFLVSMFISFTTGTSWGTFGIMMPIAITMAYELASSQLDTGNPLIMTIVYASIAAVFSGGIFGDHCSPISDTTIMSSMFSGADHIDHVNTQIPYAITVAGIGIILYVLFAAGITSPAILLPIGIALLITAHIILNKLTAKKTGLPETVPNYTVEEEQ